jgi:ribosomal protein S18 acetylase RimI-like enzyme
VRSEILIRPFTSEEGWLYRELRLRALADSPDAFGRTLAEEEDRAEAEWSQRLVEWTSSQSRLALVAFADNRSIGLAFVRLETESMDVAQIYSMWVDPVVRRRGVGHKLLATTIDWSRQHHARKVILQVTETNEAAVGLYEHAGFRGTDKVESLRAGSPLLARTMELHL